MEHVATLETPHPPNRLLPWIEDLGTYPSWLDIVPRVTPVPAVPGDPGPAWSVELRGRIGPMARSKRLRMVRLVHEPDRVVFERREADGRPHSVWRLTGELTDRPEGSRLVMRLHYGGSFWGPLLERMLGDEVERSRPRLVALLDQGGPSR